jgi:hypothetical protein
MPVYIATLVAEKKDGSHVTTSAILSIKSRKTNEVRECGLQAAKNRWPASDGWVGYKAILDELSKESVGSWVKSARPKKTAERKPIDGIPLLVLD